MAEQEVKDAQPQVKPAALLSTLHLSKTDAEVSHQKYQHTTPGRTPILNALYPATFSCDVRDLELSRSPVS